MLAKPLVRDENASTLCSLWPVGLQRKARRGRKHAARISRCCRFPGIRVRAHFTAPVQSSYWVSIVASRSPRVGLGEATTFAGAVCAAYVGIGVSFMLSFTALIVVSAVVGKWLPMLMAAAWFMLPLPAALMWGLQHDSEAHMGQNVYRNFAMFLTGVVVAASFAVPSLLFHLDGHGNTFPLAEFVTCIVANVVFLGAIAFFSRSLVDDNDSNYGAL